MQFALRKVVIKLGYRSSMKLNNIWSLLDVLFIIVLINDDRVRILYIGSFIQGIIR